MMAEQTPDQVVSAGQKAHPDDSDDPRILAKLGGDQRIFRLLEIAMTAYAWLPGGLTSVTTGKSTRSQIIEAIEAFGFRAAPIPWERFPKRFHKNKPRLQLFEPSLTDQEIAKYFDELVALNSQPVKRSPDGYRRVISALRKEAD
jgi:hypothetical protein